MPDHEAFLETKKLMHRLWPKWKADDELASLLNSRWLHLDQDKLRECIRSHRFDRNTIPDVTAIHKAYCRITGGNYADVPTPQPRRYALEQGPTEQEVADWQQWADELVATATATELAHCRERLGLLSLQTDTPGQRRVTAIAVEYCRNNPQLP
jgi:hypothetical protein